MAQNEVHSDDIISQIENILVPDYLQICCHLPYGATWSVQ